MELNGKLTISRVMSNTSDDYIEIRVQDDLSGAQYCTVQVSFVDFAQALTGLACVKCSHEPKGLSVVGKKREHKSFIASAPEALLKSLIPTITGTNKGAEKLVKHVQTQVKTVGDGWELASPAALLRRRDWTRAENGSSRFLNIVDLVRFVETQA